jgi:hypothetical protein
MRQRFIASVMAVSGVALIFSFAPALAWPWPAGQAPAATPQPYTPPRTPDGYPDLQGIWQALNTAAWDIQDHGARLGVPAGIGVVEGNEIPYQPWALKKKQENFANRLTADPETKCYLPGVPRMTYMPYPFLIVQTRDQGTLSVRVHPYHSLRLYEREAASPGPHRLVDGGLARSLGREHPCR